MTTLYLVGWRARPRISTQWSPFPEITLFDAVFWLVPTFTLLPLLLRIRSLAEHFGMDYETELRSSRNVHAGLIERFFRSLKEECVWQHNFADFHEARRAIHQWIQWYNQERPHQSLGYLSPLQYRAQQALLLA